MTLVIYDAENLKVPKKGKGSYKAGKVDMKKLIKNLKKRIASLSYDLVYFGEELQPNSFFYKKLKKLGFELREKKPIIRHNSYNGFHYKYRKCDLDVDIIDYLHKNGRRYNKIVLMSGDKDMYPVLKHLHDQGKEIWVVAHEENLSTTFLEFNTIKLHELL